MGNVWEGTVQAILQRKYIQHLVWIWISLIYWKFVALLAMIALSAVHSSTQTCIHNVILFIDISINDWYNQDHWKFGKPYLSIIASNAIVLKARTKNFPHLSNVQFEHVIHVKWYHPLSLYTQRPTKPCQVYRPDGSWSKNLLPGHVSEFDFLDWNGKYLEKDVIKWSLFSGNWNSFILLEFSLFITYLFFQALISECIFNVLPLSCRNPAMFPWGVSRTEQPQKAP